MLGYHKAAKVAELGQWAEIFGVTDLPPQLLRSIFITPFPSLQVALDRAIDIKGKYAKALFLLDGAGTVPLLDGQVT